jgi:hypothetical protein
LNLLPRAFDGKTIAIMVFLAIATALVAYGFVSAWFAPLCRNFRDLESWCLPIGFEGPFSDIWANHSLHNARLLASGQLFVIGPSFIAAIYFLLVQRGARAPTIGWVLVIMTLLTLLLPAIFLNRIS